MSKNKKSCPACPALAAPLLFSPDHKIQPFSYRFAPFSLAPFDEAQHLTSFSSKGSDLFTWGPAFIQQVKRKRRARGGVKNSSVPSTAPEKKAFAFLFIILWKMHLLWWTHRSIDSFTTTCWNRTLGPLFLSLIDDFLCFLDPTF